MISIHPRHFGIVVTDLDRALAFYRDVLGLRVARRMDEDGPFIETILGLPSVRVTTVKLEAEPGGVQVELLRFHTHGDAAHRAPAIYETGPTHMAFTVSDLNALYRRITEAGLSFVSEPRLSVDGRAKVAFCRDPDGSLLELVELVAA